MKKTIAFTFLMLLSIATMALQPPLTETITLAADNTLVLNQAFTGQSVAKLMEEADKMNSSLKSGYPIYLLLYTPGGSIQAGLELYDYLKGLNRPIHTITMFAASMGFQTVQHLDKRYITRYGVLMSHSASGSFSGSFGGQRSQLDSRYGMWLRRVEMMDQMTVDRSHFLTSLEQFYAMYAPELWLNGVEAVKIGLADAVAIVKCDASLTGSYDKVFNLGLFSVLVTFAKCPIRTAPLGVKMNLLTNKGNMSVNEFLTQGGKFGDKCRMSSQPVLNQYGEISKTMVPAELCALDKKITYDSLIKLKAEKTMFLNRNLRNHIIKSY